MTFHENHAETTDEFQYETIDLSSPEFSKDTEMNVCKIMLLKKYAYYYIF